MTKVLNVECLKQNILKEFKQLAGQTLVYGMGTMVPRLLNYIILTPYFTRNLFKDALEEYGKVTELYAYMAFLMIILTYGMETTYFRFVNKEENKTKVFSTIFTCILVTSILFLVSIFIFTEPIANGLKYGGEAIFIRLLGSLLAIEAISAIPFAKLRVENKAKKFAILKFLQVCVNIGLMIGIYNIGPKFTGDNSYLLNGVGEVSSQFIFFANLIASSFVVILLIPELKVYSLKNFDLQLLRPLLIYGLPLMISGLAGTINETLDRSIYKHVIGDDSIALAELGIYGANYKIGGLLLIFIQMFRYAAEPYFFSKSKDIDSKEQYAQLMNLFVGLIIAMGLFILLFLGYLKGFIGPNYQSGLYIVPYIILGYIFYGVLFNLSVWFKLSDRTKYAFIIMLFGAVITVVINVIFVPKYRFGASAVAHVISYGSMVLLSYILGRRFYRINYNIRRLFSYFLLGIGIYLLDMFVTIHSEILEVLFKLLLLLIFVTFVAWKEKLLKYLKINES